jgi:hypothetical protein
MEEAERGSLIAVSPSASLIAALLSDLTEITLVLLPSGDLMRVLLVLVACSPH